VKKRLNPTASVKTKTVTIFILASPFSPRILDEIQILEKEAGGRRMSMELRKRRQCTSKVIIS